MGGWTVSQVLFTYGLWILLGLIFAAMVVFGVSACRIERRQSLREDGELENDQERQGAVEEQPALPRQSMSGVERGVKR
jgi:hypothetical protein